MKNWKRGTRILLLVTFGLSVAALVLLPGLGSANMPMSHEGWVATPESLEMTVQCCDDGEVCLELCEIWNNGSGNTVPLGIFDCFPE